MLSENAMLPYWYKQGQRESHRKFAEKYNLPFILLSDPELEVIKNTTSGGRRKCTEKLFRRGKKTYIIDENGIIEKAMPNVKPDTNAEKIIKYLTK